MPYESERPLLMYRIKVETKTQLITEIAWRFELGWW